MSKLGEPRDLIPVALMRDLLKLLPTGWGWSYAVIFKGLDMNSPVEPLVKPFQKDLFRVESEEQVPFLGGENPERWAVFTFTLSVRSSNTQRMCKVNWEILPKEAHALAYMDDTKALNILPLPFEQAKPAGSPK